MKKYKEALKDEVKKYKKLARESVKHDASLKPSHTERKHHLLGGSTASRWTNCTASVAFCEGIKVPVTFAMDKGTAIHELAEAGLRDFISKKLTGKDKTLLKALTQDIVAGMDRGSCPVFQTESELEEALDMVKGYINNIWLHVLDQSVTDKVMGVEGEFVLNENLQIGGTADFWCIYIDDRGRRVGVIVDLKTGYNEVKVEKNDQLISYGAAMLKWVRDQSKELDIVKTAIYQPASEGDGYKEQSYTVKQIDTWVKKAEKAAHAIVVSGKTKFKSGHWCGYCPGKNLCPKYVEELERKSDLTLINTKKVKFKRPETLSPEQLNSLLVHGPEVKRYIDDAHKYVMGLCTSGVGFEGWKVVEGKPRRRWKHNEEEIGKKLIKLGVEDPFQCKLKPFTHIEKLIGKKINPFLTIGSASIKLVPENDERQKIGDAADFLGLEDLNDDE